MNLIVVWLAWLGVMGSGSLEARPHVVIETELGDVKIEIYQDKAPLTAANFLNYVDGERGMSRPLLNLVG